MDYNMREIDDIWTNALQTALPGNTIALYLRQCNKLAELLGTDTTTVRHYIFAGQIPQKFEHRLKLLSGTNGQVIRQIILSLKK